MTIETTTNRLKYRWVVTIASVLLIGGTFCRSARRGAGLGYDSVMNAGIWAVDWAMFSLLFGMFLAIWLVGSWALLKFGFSWRGRTWVAILPTLGFFLFQSATILIEPPSPQSYFEERFGAKLPADARSVEVTRPRMTDPGYVEFAFEGSKESTLHLIEAIRLEPVDMESKPLGAYFRVGHDWQADQWEEAKKYTKINRSGTGYLLISDRDMKRIIVVRDPLYAKSEADNPMGKFSE